MKVTQLCLTQWPYGLDSPWNSLGQNPGVGSLSCLQGIFPTQWSNPGLPHCRQIPYQLSHKESPRILEWVAYPFSSGSSWSRNQTGVSCIAGGVFTNWAMRKAQRFNNCLKKKKRKKKKEKKKKKKSIRWSLVLVGQTSDRLSATWKCFCPDYVDKVVCMYTYVVYNSCLPYNPHFFLHFCSDSIITNWFLRLFNRPLIVSLSLFLFSFPSSLFLHL